MYRTDILKIEEKVNMIKWRAEFKHKSVNTKGQEDVKWLGFVDFIQFDMSESVFSLAYRLANQQMQTANVVTLFRL